MMGDEEHGGEGADDLARLIRLAGERTPLPEERVERAREEARRVWQREIRRRVAWREIRGGAALAAAASLVVAIAYWLTLREGVPTAGVGGMGPIEVVVGEAQVREPSGGRLQPPRPFVAAATVPMGSVLTTTEATRAAIRLPSGHSLRLDHSTEVRLAAAERLHLDRGALYLASASESPAPRPLSVETPQGVVREIGTQFEVRLDHGSVRVRVREGSVVLSRDDAEREVAEGTELALDDDGSMAAREIPTNGPEWDWVSWIAPMLDLDGRTAGEFLRWAAREQGWRLVFDDAAVEEAAATTEVAGDIRGMSITQALDAVVPTCGLSYTVEEGVMKVAAVP